MPEGHLYHRLARNLNEFTGCALAACSPQGRFAEGAAQIDGTRLEVAEVARIVGKRPGTVRVLAHRGCGGWPGGWRRPGCHVE